MWCANCQADVAAEVTTDNRRLRCATCGTDLFAHQVAVAEKPVLDESKPSLEQKSRDARELLERWSGSAMLDPFGPAFGTRQAVETDPSPKPVQPAAASPQPQAAIRVDNAHLQEAATHNAPNAPRPNVHAAAASGQRKDVARIDLSHSAPMPHFDLQWAIQKDQPRGTNWVAVAGQLLAYGGVLALTVGASLVLWSYFGGPANYAPTGWLVTTVGQMLLFLGIITLVSGGIEQTTEEVTRRIDTLGERIIRIEQVSIEHALRGPNIPAGVFDGGNADAASGNERVIVEE